MGGQQSCWGGPGALTRPPRQRLCVPNTCRVLGGGHWAVVPEGTPAGKPTETGSQAGRSGRLLSTWDVPRLGRAQTGAVILCVLGFGDWPCRGDEEGAEQSCGLTVNGSRAQQDPRTREPGSGRRAVEGQGTSMWARGGASHMRGLDPGVGRRMLTLAGQKGSSQLSPGRMMGGWCGRGLRVAEPCPGPPPPRAGPPAALSASGL